MPARDEITFGIIIVAYSYTDSTAKLARQISKQKSRNDFLIIVDNHPDHAVSTVVESIGGVDLVVKTENKGFSAGLNDGRRHLPKSINTILVVNPDASLKENAINNMRKNIPEEWAAWMGMVTMPNGQINSAGNTLHLTGLSWCRELGRKPSMFSEPREINNMSGAFFAVRANDWDYLGGMPEIYFLYYEDTEFSFRLKLLGKKIGLKPDAAVIHDYSFVRGKYKWYYLERNRQLFIFRNYPLPIILALLPMLLMIELGLIVVSLIQMRGITKLRSSFSFSVLAIKSLSARKKIQNTRAISLRQLIEMFDTDITGKQLHTYSFINPFFRLYAWFMRLVFR